MTSRPSTWIALLRGVNVGGRTSLPMKTLVAMLRGLGLHDVRTYLQSGNAVFRSRAADPAELADRIRREIHRRGGFDPAVLVLDLKGLEAVARGNPFPEAEPRPTTLHVYFLGGEPEAPDLEGLERNRSDSERFVIRGRVFYLHAPDGIGRSRLAGTLEKLLGVPATGRNWRSVTRILELARQAAADK